MFSEFFLIGIFPVLKVWLVHECVVASEHAVDDQSDKDREWEEEEELSLSFLLKLSSMAKQYSHIKSAITLRWACTALLMTISFLSLLSNDEELEPLLPLLLLLLLLLADATMIISKQHAQPALRTFGRTSYVATWSIVACNNLATSFSKSELVVLEEVGEEGGSVSKNVVVVLSS